MDAVEVETVQEERGEYAWNVREEREREAVVSEEPIENNGGYGSLLDVSSVDGRVIEERRMYTGWCVEGMPVMETEHWMEKGEVEGG